LKLHIISEGVEYTGQMEMLKALGCNNMQGFLFSRPVCMDSMTGLLKDNKLLSFGGT